jgi:tRNA(fMet)-specific endonuclease VapC
MSRICLDTSAYSHFKRGDAAAVREVTQASWIGVPTIVLGELHAGFALGDRRVSNHAELTKFLAHPVVEVLHVDEEAAAIYADVFVALRRAGTPLPTNDIWIASVAAREGAPVVTYDGHFGSIARIGSKVLTRA